MDEVVGSQLRRWAEDLVDLTRRNRLLYFSHTQSASLEFGQDALEVEAGLERRLGWSFHLPPPPPDDPAVPYDLQPPGPDELVVALTPKRYRPQLERSLKTLKARAEAEFLDAGIWVLYLGLGCLDWVDVDKKPARSPLLLVPVSLQQEGAGRVWRMRRSDAGEPALNPALSVKLERDFGIVLPTLDDLEDPSVANVLSAVAEAVPAGPWKVGPVAVMRPFTFHKEVIYRDLRGNEDEIAKHDTVRLLAEGPSSAVAQILDFTPEDEDSLDLRHPPENLACVVDADATQRQCLIAARDGRSFVMDGPPGTGKSQTITNVIAQLLADGKTVLFVSEKAAALEVVHNRLRELKLDPFVMALHSHNATRKAVAQELGRALEERPTARSRLDATGRARLKRDRERLTAYAMAVNEVRRPLERSLHDVIGRVATLTTLPLVPVPEVDTSRLDPERLGDLLDTAGQLGRSWGPIERGDRFLWRDLERLSGGAAREADLRRRLQSCGTTLQALRAAAVNAAEELRLRTPQGPTQTEILAGLQEVLEEQVPVGEAWLTTPEAEAVGVRVAQLIAKVRACAEAKQRLAARSSRWAELDRELDEELRLLEAELAASSPAPGPFDLWNSIALDRLATALDEASDLVIRMQPPASVLRSAFGIDGTMSLDLVGRLAELGRLAGSPNAPEPAWLNPVVGAALDEARRVLADLLQTYRSRRDALQSTFKESVLDLDLRSMHVRFKEVNTGIRKLGGAHRADKRELSQATVSGRVGKDVLAKLDEALEWQDLAARLTQAEQRHASQLGPRYYASRSNADLDEIERAVALADQALALAAGEVSPADLARQIGLGSDPDPRLPQAVEAVVSRIGQLRSGSFNHQLGAVAASVEQLGLVETISWCGFAAARLRRLAGLVRSIESVIGESLTVSEVRRLTADRRDLELRSAEADEQVQELAAYLGELAADPSLERLEAATDWVIRVRSFFDGPVPRQTAAVLLRTDLANAELRDSLALHAKTTAALFGEFSGTYGMELRQECWTSFEVEEALLTDLAESVGDVTEWETYVRARTSLIEAGWRATIEDCEAQRVPSGAVALLIERTVLARWVDQVMDSDTRLDPKRSVDRDELLRAFQALDTELVSDAAAGVINACAAQRPRSLAGGAGIIRQQAQLKRRHMPVRRLLENAGEAAQKLKPCFMMSPLSVSQFLPSSLRFDLVIFDEASQVREADAICCIYRGRQLIVAGDPKQLPPTDFFSRSTDNDDDLDTEVLDFESVLDRCKAQGFTNLPLNWHYRSRHESLITFSNRSFYGGRLHTFPSATFESADLGVELFPVKGEYRRGGTRDNPIEAEAVVDRIVEHRRRRPHLTLGVVALSVAQQCAIEAAIERRSASEPELRELVTDDRLDGFFVKNLENVQGDERDLIILSIGYGPDENGKLTMNFGPMNKEGGERRLNVAVTRARRRVEVVSSVSAGQITSEKSSIRHLARYLDYAERGVAALATEIEAPCAEPESPFEEEVLRSVCYLGYEAVPQVGVAGFRIDIGVRHPSKRGTYALGIECDGATYHSSKVARDRDRLRQEVLEGLGWRIHRIWSTAWFTDRSTEEARLRASIEAALRTSAELHDDRPPSAPPVEIIVEEVDFDGYPDWVYQYISPQVSTPSVRGTEFTDPGARSTIGRQIMEVVVDYGPVHCAVVLDVVRAEWGVGRSGSRVRDAFQAALRTLTVRGAVHADGEFLEVPEAEVYVRVPGDEDFVRRVAHVPPAELDLAVVQLLGDAGISDAARLRLTWARLFGWRRVGSDIEVAFDDAVDRLVLAGLVEGPDPLRLRSSGEAG